MFQTVLKQLRENKGLSQAELAKILNLSQQTIGHYEVGRAAPTLETLIRIADFFEVSLDYLLCRTLPEGAESQSQDKNSNDTFVERMASLGEAERKAIETLLDFREEKEDLR